MKALMKMASGAGNVELKDVPVPEIGENDVLIKVLYAGVCGTDNHIYYDRFHNNPPLILGHEFSGVIEKAGSLVKEWAPGDKVVAENNPFACLKCRICRLGYPNMCPSKMAMGILSDGCFAEYMKLPSWLLHRIPDKLCLETASLAEPTAVAAHAVIERGKMNSGDTVLVMGPGTIGLLSAQIARASGAETVIIFGTDKDKSRLNLAKELGIDISINVEQEDPEEIVKELTSGEGVDMVVEASGSPKAILLASKVVRRLGCMVCPGLTGMKDVRIPWDTLISKGINIIFPYSSNFESWRRALSLMSESKIDVVSLIGRKYELDEWAAAFKNLEEMKEIKPLFVIGTKNEERC